MRVRVARVLAPAGRRDRGRARAGRRVFVVLLAIAGGAGVCAIRCRAWRSSGPTTSSTWRSTAGCSPRRGWRCWRSSGFPLFLLVHGAARADVRQAHAARQGHRRAIGERPSIVRSLVRTPAYLPSLVLLALGLLWIGFDREKRGLHDWLADTYVVKGASHDVAAGIAAGAGRAGQRQEDGRGVPAPGHLRRDARHDPARDGRDRRGHAARRARALVGAADRGRSAVARAAAGRGGSEVDAGGDAESASARCRWRSRVDACACW